MATGRKKPIEEIEEMAAELFGCTWDMTAKKTKKKKKKKKSKKKWKKEGEGDKEDGDGRGRLGIPLAEQSRLISYLLVDLTAAPVPPPPPLPNNQRRNRALVRCVFLHVWPSFYWNSFGEHRITNQLLDGTAFYQVPSGLLFTLVFFFIKLCGTRH